MSTTGTSAQSELSTSGMVQLATIPPAYPGDVYVGKDLMWLIHIRAQVEGTISEAVRFHGLRKAKCKGESSHRLQFYLTGAALNVKRLIKP